MRFKDNLVNPEKIPLIFEVVPPNKNLAPKKINLFINNLLKFLSKTKVDALFIPELISESKRSLFPLKEKVEPRVFAQKIQQRSKKKIKIIISRVTVHHSVKNQKKWLLQTYDKFQIKDIVLVGGEKEAKYYPGLSVSQTVQLIKSIAPNKICCGGITIPTRRFKTFDEPERIINKQKSGIEFFISQIIFEPETTIKLLKDYYQACQKQNLKPARFFLSFTSVSLPKDIEFLESLGVFIPLKIKNFLLQSKNQMGKNSIKLAKKIFDQILEFIKKNKIETPLGVNISYLTKRNFEISQNMVKFFK